MRWANEHPEQMAEIAALPPSQQNAALREAIGYDPDAICDRLEESSNALGASSAHPPETPAGVGRNTSQGPPAGTTDLDGHCDVCGAPVGKHHLSYCDLRGDV